MKEDIKKQVRDIAQAFYRLKNVESVVLSGSFSRDEGSVIKKKGKYVPQNDYDFYLFTSGKVKGVSRVVKEIQKKYSLPENFGIIGGIIPINKLKWLAPDLSKYELKVNGKVIKGKNYLSRIRIKPKDFPLISCLRILFVKFKGLVFVYPFSKRTEKTLIYECHKTYVEFATILSILGGFYRPTYRERLDLVKKNFSKFGLKKDLLKKIENGTKFKLNPDYSKIKDSKKLWFETKEDLLYFLRFVCKKYFGFEKRFYYNLEKTLDLYYAPYWNYYLGFGGNLLSRLTVWYKKRKSIRGRYYLFAMYLSSVALLEAIEEDGFDERALKVAREYLGNVKFEVLLKRFRSLFFTYVSEIEG